MTAARWCCRPRADTQLVSDELGRQPLQEKGQDLSLALCQQRLPGVEFLDFEWSVASLVAARQGFLDSGQQRFGVERLLDKMVRPRLHRRDGRRHVAIRRYHDDGQSLVAATTCLRSSMPLMPGSWLSRRMQAGSLRDSMSHILRRSHRNSTRSERSTEARSAHPAPLFSSTMCTRRSCSIVIGPIDRNSTTNRAPPVLTRSHQRRPACL